MQIKKVQTSWKTFKIICMHGLITKLMITQSCDCLTIQWDRHLSHFLFGFRCGLFKTVSAPGHCPIFSKYDNKFSKNVHK